MLAKAVHKTITIRGSNMNQINKSPAKGAKKATSKQKWCEIEASRDRYELMKELRENDYSLEMDIEELGL
jgi:hypothetical protein